jgi:hypothetical protein
VTYKHIKNFNYLEYFGVYFVEYVCISVLKMAVKLVYSSGCTHNVSCCEELSGELLCLEAAQGATKQNPHLLGVSESPATWEDSDNGQPLQEPGTSGTQIKVKEKIAKYGPSTTGPNSTESKGPSQGPGKRRRLSGGTPEGGQEKMLKSTGQPSCARAAQEGIRMAIVCDSYPEIKVSKENFVGIQLAIGRLVDELPEEGFTPRLIDTYWNRGAAIMVCQDEETRDWLASKVPTLTAWEGSRLKMVGLDVLSAYRRVVAWFPGPVEDTGRYFQRLCMLNQGLDTRHWRVYDRKEEKNGVRLVLSIDTTSVTVLERMGWRPFSGVGQAIFSLQGVKPEGKK